MESEIMKNNKKLARKYFNKYFKAQYFAESDFEFMALVRLLNKVSKTNNHENPVIIKDKNGNPIREGDRFKFKFMEQLHKHIELIGSFDYNDEELRYEVDIWNHENYICLSYLSNGLMYDFELI